MVKGDRDHTPVTVVRPPPDAVCKPAADPNLKKASDKEDSLGVLGRDPKFLQALAAGSTSLVAASHGGARGGGGALLRLPPD